MAIPEAAAADVLVKCARHCCICRRRDPLHLQVHHIILVSEGGTDDPDNLIAVCLTCHCDVHTKVHFTRSFTAAELKGHRDAVYALVAQGKLPFPEVPGAVADAAAAVKQLAAVRMKQVSLSQTQVEVLVTAGTAKGHNQGLVEITLYQIQMGEKTVIFEDQREGARYREAFQGLLTLGVFDRTECNTMLYLNGEGFRMVDQLLAMGVRDTTA